MKRVATLALALLLAGTARAQTWKFDVQLDGRPIGTHQFTVFGPANAREVHSLARLDVKLLGLTVYRYRHDARERWRGDCVVALQSHTDDDGKPLSVKLQHDDIDAGDNCQMGFAYWNPRVTTQTRLLNPQTGQVDQARFERLPDATLPVAGRQVAAARWRLTATPTSGSAQELTLWQDAADGRWIGLDARVKGGRLLTYRLN